MVMTKTGRLCPFYHLISLFIDSMVITKVPWWRPVSALPLSLKTTLDWHIASNTSYFRYMLQLLISGKNFGWICCLTLTYLQIIVLPYQGSQSLPYPNVLQTLAGRCVSPGASRRQIKLSREIKKSPPHTLY